MCLPLVPADRTARKNRCLRRRFPSRHQTRRATSSTRPCIHSARTSAKVAAAVQAIRSRTGAPARTRSVRLRALQTSCRTPPRDAAAGRSHSRKSRRRGHWVRRTPPRVESVHGFALPRRTESACAVTGRAAREPANGPGQHLAPAGGESAVQPGDEHASGEAHVGQVPGLASTAVPRSCRHQSRRGGAPGFFSKRKISRTGCTRARDQRVRKRPWTGPCRRMPDRNLRSLCQYEACAALVARIGPAQRVAAAGSSPGQLSATVMRALHLSARIVIGGCWTLHHD